MAIALLIFRDISVDLILEIIMLNLLFKTFPQQKKP